VYVLWQEPCRKEYLPKEKTRFVGLCSRKWETQRSSLETTLLAGCTSYPVKWSVIPACTYGVWEHDHCLSLEKKFQEVVNSRIHFFCWAPPPNKGRVCVHKAHQRSNRTTRVLYGKSVSFRSTKLLLQSFPTIFWTKLLAAVLLKLVQQHTKLVSHLRYSWLPQVAANREVLQAATTSFRLFWIVLIFVIFESNYFQKFHVGNHVLLECEAQRLRSIINWHSCASISLIASSECFWEIRKIYNL
jgi:hypothetical protein